MAQAGEPTVLTIREAADLIGERALTIRRWIREGRLSAELVLTDAGWEYVVLGEAVVELSQGRHDDTAQARWADALERSIAMAQNSGRFATSAGERLRQGRDTVRARRARAWWARLLPLGRS
ncbi:MAG: hypothetical protein V3V06_02300 [Dehalococcoidia bacterium]